MFEGNIMIILTDVVIFLIGLYLLNRFAIKKKNMGFYIRNSAYMLGFAIAISSSFLSNGMEFDITYPLFAAIDMAIVLSLLYLSIKINNKFILSGINNDKMILQGNLSIPIIEAGTIIATSIILFSSMYGEGKYIDALLFFVLGQGALFLMFKIYERSTRFDDLKLIEDNNISISLVLFSVIVGFSLIIATSIFGDSSEIGILEDIISFVYVFLFSVILLIIFLNRLLDKLFFPSHIIEEEIEKDNISVVLPYSIMKLSIIIIIAVII